MGQLDIDALIAQAKQAAAQTNFPLPGGIAPEDAQLFVDTFIAGANPFEDNSLSFQDASGLAGNVAAASQQAREGSGVQFGDFIEAPDFNFGSLEAGLSQRLGLGINQGVQRAKGSLARRGLLGSGAEAGVDLQGGVARGQGSVDIKRSLELKQLDFDTLKANRANIFNQAKAAFEQGQIEAANKLLFQYDALNAELTSRQSEGGNILGTIAGGVGGFFAGGPQGALAGAQIGSSL